MNGRRALKLCLSLFIGLVLIVSGASGQTRVYRQTNLVSDIPGAFTNPDVFMQNPWGIAFGPGQPFFIPVTARGQVRFYDPTGNNVFPFAFRILPSAADLSRSRPTGIVFNPNAQDFILGGIASQYVVVSQDGTISGWADEDGDLPTFATLGRDDSSSGAVYTGVSILNPVCCREFLAVADFHNGRIQTLDTHLNLTAVTGNFSDPDLPPGYAPFNIQQIGTQVFVIYALQDEAKHDPVAGAGNGIVDIFDQEGRFVRRFATGGSLNAPWGITVASTEFGQFSSDILISNSGDGTISAFDATTGNFAGQIQDGDGKLIENSGIRALTFRPDGLGDPNTLYFAAGLFNGQAGLFGAITAGLVSTTQVSASPSRIESGDTVSVTANVAAGTDIPGNPVGEVAFQIDGGPISSAPLVDGAVRFDIALQGAGNHIIAARYSGDSNFLSSDSQAEVRVEDHSTTVTLTAPAAAAPGEAVRLLATITSPGGIPTGTITFRDGTIDLGAVPLDATGVATLTVNNLAAGAHSLAAEYSGDGVFRGSTSATVTTTIANKDFTVAAAPSAATVVAGQSATFSLTVTPAGGFANNVTFSCAPVTGITCTFDPPMVTPANGTANTMLTVTTSANVIQFGLLVHEPIGPAFVLATLAMLSLVVWQSRKFPRLRASMLTAGGVLAVLALSAGLGGCGGYNNTAQANRGTATINVTAQSGALSHATTVSVTVQ